jgi:hypothetical protein
MGGGGTGSPGTSKGVAAYVSAPEGGASSLEVSSPDSGGDVVAGGGPPAGTGAGRGWSSLGGFGGVGPVGLAPSTTVIKKLRGHRP